MRALRLLALAAVLLLAYVAQYLFDNGTLAGLYPAWTMQRFPALVRTTYWLPQDLYTLALGLLGGSALLFGLLVPAWPRLVPGGGGTSWRSHLLEVPPPGGPTSWKWGVSVLLMGVLVLVAWGWTGLPVRIDAGSARFGLQAQALLAGEGSWLAPGVTGAPQVAGLLAGLLTFVLGSGPAAAHLLGLLAALVTVAATSLLAGELFVLSPQRRQLGLLAGGFTACTLALLHFGRLAPYLPATAAGTTAAYLLLIGHRRQRGVWLVGSGLLVALACWFDRTGLVFAALLIAWWPSLRFDEGPRGRLHWLVWVGCLLAALFPLLLYWLIDPQTFSAYLNGGGGAAAVDWWANLRTTAATFFWTPDASAVLGPAGHFVNSLVAPLFVLAVGGLLMSVDRPLGWRLISWLVLGMIFSSVANAVAPYWPTLLPLLPLVGIAIVYALDRIGALWAEAGGGAGASASVAVGLLLAAAAVTAAGYYQFVAMDGDAPSYTGRALAALAPDSVAVLVASTPEGAVRLDDPVVQFAAGPRANQALAVLSNALPPSLPGGSQIIVQGADQAALAAVRTAYPQAAVEVVRDLRANPRLYIVRVNSTP